ncbi:MAG: hypothetical protein MI924_06155 [Chloroflexales bacterium]|nr:hypothetical protein [Chloroflexales bacterium]
MSRPGMAGFAAGQDGEVAKAIVILKRFQLTAAVFSAAPMRERWAEMFGYTEGAHAILYLCVRLDPSAEALHHLRWELLCDPKNNVPLCRSERFLFSRYLDTNDDDWWAPVLFTRVRDGCIWTTASTDRAPEEVGDRPVNMSPREVLAPFIADFRDASIVHSSRTGDRRPARGER